MIPAVALHACDNVSIEDSGAVVRKLERQFVDGCVVGLTLGDELIDSYLGFVGTRARLNTWLAVGYDLQVFFSMVAKPPATVTATDVFRFIEHQRRPRRDGVVRLEDGEAGLSARTIKRRLSSVSGLYAYLCARPELGVTVNPVPRGLAARGPNRDRRNPRPLIRAPRMLPRVLSPSEVNAFTAALRTNRDRAIVAAMLLGGLRRCEALGLRFEDIRVGEQRLFIADGKGGHQRLVPVSATFYSTLANYLDHERPAGPTSATDAVFVVLKGPRRGSPLTPAGMDEVMSGASKRAGLQRPVTCHQLRHTCLTRLREAGMALEAVQAQAGHRSIETTRVYLQLGDRWMANEYHTAIAVIDADLAAL